MENSIRSYIQPSDNDYNISLDGCTKIVLGESGTTAIQPFSIPYLLQDAVEEFPDSPALCCRDSDGNSNTISYRDYQKKTHHIAKAFIKLGLEIHHSVGVIAFNCPEWFYSLLGAIHARGIISGIYTTNSPEAIQHCLHKAKANIVVVDDIKQLEKIRQIRNRLPFLKSIIQINGPFLDGEKDRMDGYYTWPEIESLDVSDCEEEYLQRLEKMVVNECCALIYTSGTVGLPKGVLISHDALTWASRSALSSYPNIVKGAEVLVSYLPLSHIAASLFDIVNSIVMRACVHFADRNALKGTLVKTLVAAQPTRFIGVPRVYEKIVEKMSEIEKHVGVIKRFVLNWAKNAALNRQLSLKDGQYYNSWSYMLAKTLVLDRLKYALGLGRCQTLVVGAAPTSAATKKAFCGLDMRIIECYGMSECGLHSMMPIENLNFDSVGIPLDGIETRIDNPDESRHGEICLRGRNRFMGYLDDLEKTKETIDIAGWLHTGDIGYLDENNYLYVTGRIKELIITSGGENIPPNHIEDLVKLEIPALSNAFLIGDRRKYLAMMVTLKTEMDLETGYPKDELRSESIELMKSLGLKYTKLSEILNAGPSTEVLNAIQEGLNRANQKAISNAQRVQKFALLSHDFSIPTGELGPTLKLKRNVVLKMYDDVIESLY